jgi:hypothetical protein
MRRVRKWIGTGLLVASLGAVVAVGQASNGGTAASADENDSLPKSVGGVLRGLASRAGVIFIGQVQTIVWKEGVVEITFLVEKPVLGAAAGQYVEREWAGRWTGGQERYRVGQRAMFFLQTPSAAGLSSPVDGMTGVVSVVPTGADGIALLDARMLATRVVRPLGTAIVDADFGAVPVADAEAVVRNWQSPEVPEPKRVVLPGKAVVTPAHVRGAKVAAPEAPEEKVNDQR